MAKCNQLSSLPFKGLTGPIQINGCICALWRMWANRPESEWKVKAPVETQWVYWRLHRL